MYRRTSQTTHSRSHWRTKCIWTGWQEEKLTPLLHSRLQVSTKVGLKSCVASGKANLLEWRDVKVLGTCLFQTGTIWTHTKTQNGHDTAARYLRFVNQLPNLPQVQHLGSVIRGFVASPNPLFRDEHREQTLNSWKVNSFLTSLSLQEAERPTSLTGKLTTGNAVATSTRVEQHWSCSFSSSQLSGRRGGSTSFCQLCAFLRHF